MANGTDILIIGGGIIGCSIAWTLRDCGLSIRIIDASASHPVTTIAAAGMLAPSFEVNAAHSDAGYGYFAHQCLRQWPEFVRDLEDATEYNVDFQQRGALSVAITKEDHNTLYAEYMTHQHGGSDTDADRAWIRVPGHADQNSIMANLSPQIQAGLFAPQEAQIDPRKTLFALKCAIERTTTINWVSSAVSKLQTNANTISAVVTSNGDVYQADQIILASGNGIHQIKTDFAVPKIVPVKGEALAVAMGTSMPGDRTCSIMHDPIMRGPIIRDKSVYLCPKGDGRLLIGATQIAGVDEPSIDQHRVDALKMAAITLMPAIATMPEVERWSGIRPGTPDDRPYIGYGSTLPDNLLFAIGHYRNGILFAPRTAQLIKGCILGQSVDPCLAQFAPDRAITV